MAVALGYPHPDHLLRTMTSSQLTELIAFYTLEGFGAVRDDLRSGIAASQLANSQRPRGAKPLPVSAFMPQFEHDKPKETSQQLSERIKTVMRAFNGKSRQPRNPDRG